MAIRADRVGVRQDQVDIHGRVTSPSFLNELLEDLPEWTDMPVWVNGTEELLPSNNSVPVTSPILADIAYPDIRRDNQYFTYRESPTPVDGLAKIKSIKGNTLVCNQLVSSASGWTSNNGTLSQSGNTYTYTVTALGDYDYQNRMQRAFPFVIPKGHKMFLSCEFYYPRNTPILIYMIRANSGSNRSISGTTVANQWTRISGIQYDTSTEFGYYQLALDTTASNGYSVGDSVQVRNPMAIDLTMLFGEGNEPSTVEEFTSLFSLPYYDYNTGILLSFNGTGLKTVGKNLVNPNDFVQGLLNWQTGELNTNVQWITSPFISVFDSTSVTVQGWKDGTEENFMVRFTMYDSSYNVIANSNNINVSFVEHYQRKVVMPSNTKYIRFSCGFNNKTTTPQTFFATNRVMLEFGETASEYEPYTSHTANLPTLTYFPTGMKSAGTVYDELTPTKAVTRIGAVDLGSLTWQYGGSLQYFYASITNMKSGTDNAVCALYENSHATTITNVGNMQFMMYENEIRIKNSSYTDATEFKTAMNGVYLYYELATPVELPTMSFE